MQIHEASSIVGLTHKSIRYYEEEGLLKPKRNNNSYREYDSEDIKNLKLIKFLRELNVPIFEIKKLKNQEFTLESCLQERIKKIEEQEKNYEIIKNMCLEIINNQESYEKIDISKYAQVLNVLEKRGFVMEPIKKSHKQKIWGAILSSLIFSLFFIFLIFIITYFQLTENSKMPWILYFFFIVLLSIPLLGIIVNLIKRIKEIKGGEEDEASKY